MSETTEMWRESKSQFRKKKAQNREEMKPIFDALISEGFEIKKLTDYQFRIEGVMDLYPSRRRWHNIKTGQRGSFKIENLMELLSNHL